MSASDGCDPLVSAAWVEERLTEFVSDASDLRLVEVSVDTGVYDEGHVPGAVRFDWDGDLQDERRFDVASPDTFATVVADEGIGPDTTVVLYGDLYNWFAAYAYWLFTYYGHEDVRLLDGGRRHWERTGRPLTTEVPTPPSETYPTPAPRTEIRVDRPDVMDHLARDDVTLIDVRSPPEYRGEVLSPPGWNEGVQRGGHVPGAVNVPWSRAVHPDGRFKPIPELNETYAPVTGANETVVYCRIGERSAHTWFVLHELLEEPHVSHYYGSWVEWGNTVGAPIEQN